MSGSTPNSEQPEPNSEPPDKTQNSQPSQQRRAQLGLPHSSFYQPTIQTLFNPQSIPKRRGRLTRRLLLAGMFTLSAISVVAMQTFNRPQRPASNQSSSKKKSDAGDLSRESASELDKAQSQLTDQGPRLLSDPFLQLPTAASVQVVWFTDFRGTEHRVEFGDGQTVAATTTRLSLMREDGDSRVPGQTYSTVTSRAVWRHEATVSGLTPGDRLPYRVISAHASGQTAISDFFTLAAAPKPGQPLKILLTSDHQLKPMTPANLQKVEETVGRVDAVFFAGDLVNVPDRASEWFDNTEGLAFFPGLQGRAQHKLKKNGTTTPYAGGQLIQHAPLFPAIGNHEVMGRHSEDQPLKAQFSNTLPRNLVSEFYPTPGGGKADIAWIKKHSYNTSTYQEIFSLPQTQLPSGKTTEQYYAVTFGDIRLVSLYVTQVWRSPSLNAETKGRYRESVKSLTQPETWGYGQHIFEDIRKGSEQYNWLEQELASEPFQQAKYKIVMLHHPPHSLGGNIVPAFTDPVQIENRTNSGMLTSVQYEYPKEEDYIIRDLIPLLERAAVDLVFYGHSHLWNRFTSEKGTHFLETSNVGNSYGAHTADNPRAVPTVELPKSASDLNPFGNLYSATGDPNGLAPIMPTIAPLKDDTGKPQPFIASNDITSFTILETVSGTVTSYYFDTRQPNSEVVKFDQFELR